MVVPLAVENSLVLRGPLEVVGNVRLERKQSNKLIDLLIVDVDFSIGKKVQNFVYISNERSWSLLFHLRCFLVRLSVFLVFYFIFLGIVIFTNTTFDQFHFRRQKRWSQINILFPTSRKFKLYAVFTKCGFRIVFFSLIDKLLPTTTNFLPRFPENATKG